MEYRYKNTYTGTFISEKKYNELVKKPDFYTKYWERVEKESKPEDIVLDKEDVPQGKWDKPISSGLTYITNDVHHTEAPVPARSEDFHVIARPIPIPQPLSSYTINISSNGRIVSYPASNEEFERRRIQEIERLRLRQLTLETMSLQGTSTSSVIDPRRATSMSIPSRSPYWEDLINDNLDSQDILNAVDETRASRRGIISSGSDFEF